MDDTLVGNRDIVVEAYRRVGITMPPDAWGKAWHEWLPAATDENVELIRRSKSQIYRELLDKVVRDRALPPAAVAERLMRRGDTVLFVSGASLQAMRTILLRLQLPVSNIAGAEANSDQRRSILAYWRDRRHLDIVYVDDDERRKTDADAAGVKFIHYDKQTEDELLEELEALWTP